MPSVWPLWTFSSDFLWKETPAVLVFILIGPYKRCHLAPTTPWPFQHQVSGLSAPDWPQSDFKNLRQLPLSWGNLMAFEVLFDEMDFEKGRVWRKASNVRTRSLSIHNVGNAIRTESRMPVIACHCIPLKHARFTTSPNVRQAPLSECFFHTQILCCIWMYCGSH